MTRKVTFGISGFALPEPGHAELRLSSLLHVLIVTPVIFTTIREREVRRRPH